MVAATPYLHTVALFLAVAARRVVAVSFSLGQPGSTKDSQALAAQIARPADSGHYCAEGKQLPDFYVLGAKNTATSSLYADLHSRGVMPAPGSADVKEWLFFRHNTRLPAAMEHAEWLKSLPDCGALPAMMGDFSVMNLPLIPLPSDFAWSRDLGFVGHETNTDNFDTAKRIRQFHGEAAGSMLKFVVMLREPLARLQSEYYHTLPLQNCHGCMVNETFADSLATNVELLQHQPPLMSDWFWKSFYARQIENYLQYFDAKQFFFVPNKEYFAVDPPKFSANLLAWLHIPSPPWHEASHGNEHEKPELDEELPSTSPARMAYEAAMAQENERLVRTLAQAHTQGAILAGYAGLPGDVAAIRAWLVQNW